MIVADLVREQTNRLQLEIKQRKEQKRSFEDIQKSIITTKACLYESKKALEQSANQLTHKRKLLIKQLISIYRLRKVQRSKKDAGPTQFQIEYRIVQAGIPRLDQLHLIPGILISSSKSLG